MKTDRAVAANALKLAAHGCRKLPNGTTKTCLKAEGSGCRKRAEKRAVLYPLRIALSGRETTAGGATEIAAVLGREETLARIAAASAKLGAEA